MGTCCGGQDGAANLSLATKPKAATGTVGAAFNPDQNS
jgi:hypothetical protein